MSDATLHLEQRIAANLRAEVQREVNRAFGAFTSALTSISASSYPWQNACLKIGSSVSVNTVVHEMSVAVVEAIVKYKLPAAIDGFVARVEALANP